MIALLVSKLDLKTNTKHIELFPDVIRVLGLTSVAKSAIDGIIPPDSGESATNFMKCAIASFTAVTELRLILSNEYTIMSIKLYLRNGSDRQRQQNGMKVTVEDRNGQKHQCGETYNQLTQGQYPTFECRNGILSCFIRLTLDHTKKTPVRNKPIQVCELEVFVGKIDTNNY